MLAIQIDMAKLNLSGMNLSTFYKISLSLFLTISCQFSLAQSQAPQCSSVHFQEIAPNVRGLQRLEQKLGKPVGISVRPTPHGTEVTLYDSSTGAKFGSLSAFYLDYGHQLDIVQMESVKKKIGVGEALMEAMLKQFPETEIISTGLLNETNGQVLRASLAKGLSVEDAIKETPAYKIRAHLGFSEIISGTANRHGEFEVRRPRTHRPSQ